MKFLFVVKQLSIHKFKLMVQLYGMIIDYINLLFLVNFCFHHKIVVIFLILFDLALDILIQVFYFSLSINTLCG